MEAAKFYHKRKLCNTSIGYFTDIAVLGSDPIYDRYNNVWSVVSKYIDKQYHSFLAQPDFQGDAIDWYVDEWEDVPVALNTLSGEDLNRYELIKEQTIKHYRQKCAALPTDEMEILALALRFIDDQFVYCFDGKVVLVAWGMRLDQRRIPTNGIIATDLPDPERFKVTFITGANGRLEKPQCRVLSRSRGQKLRREDIPVVVANDGYEFLEWTPSPIGTVISEDCTFTAQYKQQPSPIGEIELEQPEDPPMAQCSFSAGENGTIEGPTSFFRPLGYALSEGDIPHVTAKPGYRFMGWDMNPLNMVVNGDAAFTAQYEQELPWYKRFWIWLCAQKWLRWLLGLLLALILLAFLLRGCGPGATLGCTACHRILPVDEIGVIDSINGQDNNGVVHEITNGGSLPHGESAVAPIVGKNGEQPPIVHRDKAPDIIANRLNIYFDDDNADLDQWAKDFKQAYPDDVYKIIGYDRNVRMIQIMIPETQRDKVRQELPSKLPAQKFFVIDESIMSLQGDIQPMQDNASNSQTTTLGYGWHLTAVHANEAWGITQGKTDVVVAVVDDGIDPNHKIFDSGRFYNSYNVFTQNRYLSKGAGHGTGVAGLAAGSIIDANQGKAGIAPGCKIMPVQVFDNGLSTISSLTSGIMYAIHNGASVVNISVGPNFNGLNQASAEEQIAIAKENFKNEEMVFRHIINVANKKNVILVFAAGNDDIICSVLPECRVATQTVNVAAVGPDTEATDFTNYLFGTNISAPGKSIAVAIPGGGWTVADGTSAAAPIVTGAIALMRSIKPDLKVGQALGVMESTGGKWHRMVPPLVNIHECLKAIQSGNIPDGPVGGFGGSLDVGAGVDNVNLVDGEIVSGNGETIIIDDDDDVIRVVPGDKSRVTHEETSTGGTQSGNNGARVPIDKGGTSNESLQDLLDQLIQQRNEIDRKIQELQQQMKNN